MSLSTSDSSLSEVPTLTSNPNSNESSPRSHDQPHKPPTYTYTREELLEIAASMGYHPDLSIPKVSYEDVFVHGHQWKQNTMSDLISAKNRQPPANRQLQPYHQGGLQQRSYQPAPRQHYQPQADSAKQKTALDLLLEQLVKNPSGTMHPQTASSSSAADQQIGRFSSTDQQQKSTNDRSSSSDGPAMIDQHQQQQTRQDMFDFKSLLDEIDKKRPSALIEIYPQQTKSTHMAPSQQEHGLTNSVADFFRKAQPYCCPPNLLTDVLDSSKVLSVSKLEEELLGSTKQE